MRLRPSRRDARLVSGLILFAYVAAHLINHALGLFSIAVAERGLRVAFVVWHSLPGTILLYGAAATHIALAFIAVYERRTLRLPPIELLRIVLGFAMPTLLIAHAVGTRLAFEIYGAPPDYAHVVWNLWHSGRQGLQIALLVPGWVHGCLGLNLAFRQRQWFSRLRLPLFGSALLLPVLAVLGFLSMLKEVAELAATPGFVASTISEVGAGERAALSLLSDRMRLFYFGAIAAVLIARGVRAGVERRWGNLITISYPDRKVRVPLHWSVLEASRSHRIEHQSSCGGRGRCSTCRVRIVDGAEHCPPPSVAERRTLARVGASPDTRLACQLRPEGDVSVVPLLAGPRQAPIDGAPSERELVAMLVTARWDHLHDRLLPHDRLYAAHRFFEAVVATGTHSGGVATHPDHHQQILLYGLGESPGEAGRQALRSAHAIARALEWMNLTLQDSIGCSARCAIRLDVGLVAFGSSQAVPAGVVSAAGDPIDALRHEAAVQASTADRDACSAGTTSIWASRALLSAAGMEHAVESQGASQDVDAGRLLRMAGLGETREVAD